TYVYVDGSSPGYVYTSCAPGYLGTVVAPSGVVYYGTGFDYAPWIGNVWYGGPAAFGLGAALGFGAFGLGVAFDSLFVGPPRAARVVGHAHPVPFARVRGAPVQVFRPLTTAGVVVRPSFAAHRGFVPGARAVPPGFGRVAPRPGFAGGAIGGGPPAFRGVP